MLKSIQQFFEKKMVPTANREDVPDASAHHPVEVAACALLLELAHADAEFTDDERRHIEEVLARHFALDDATVKEVMSLAERERLAAVDLYQFTALVNRYYDEGQRMVLAELMWRVVYADGRLQKHERHLMHKLSSLLELRPGFLAEARDRAVQDDGTAEDDSG